MSRLLRSCSRSSVRDCSFESIGLSAKEDAPDIGMCGKCGGGSLAVIAAVHEDVCAVSDGQGLARILLHHGDRGAGPMDRDDLLEQTLRRDRRQTGRGLVEQ